MRCFTNGKLNDLFVKCIAQVLIVCTAYSVAVLSNKDGSSILVVSFCFSQNVLAAAILFCEEIFLWEKTSKFAKFCNLNSW